MAPLPGAVVRLYDAETGTPVGDPQRTDRAGAYRFTAVPVGWYYVQFEAPGQGMGRNGTERGRLATSSNNVPPTPLIGHGLRAVDSNFTLCGRAQHPVFFFFQKADSLQSVESDCDFPVTFSYESSKIEHFGFCFKSNCIQIPLCLWPLSSVRSHISGLRKKFCLLC